MTKLLFLCALATTLLCAFAAPTKDATVVEGELNHIVQDFVGYSVSYATIEDEAGHVTRFDIDSLPAEATPGSFVRLTLGEKRPLATIASGPLAKKADGWVKKTDLFRAASCTVVQAKAAPKASANGSRSLLLVHVTHSDTAGSCNFACAQNNMWDAAGNNVADFYNEISYGNLAIPDASGDRVAITLGSTSAYTDCDSLSQMRTAFNAEVNANTPYNTANYEMLAYYTGSICGIGVAWVNGFQSFQNSIHPDTLAHELGHNFNMNHAGLDVDDNGVTEDQYGDESAVMGYSHVGLRGINAPHREQHGWVPASAIHPLGTTCVEVVQIAALRHTPDNTYGYTILTYPNPAGGVYTISYRQKDTVSYDRYLRNAWANRVYVHTDDNRYTQQVVRLQAAGTYTFGDGAELQVFSIDGDSATIRMLTCDEVNECLTNNGGCDQICDFIDGSVVCDCDSLYELQPDGFTCLEFNACSSANGGCDQICVNEAGEAVCDCWEGFELQPDGYSCEMVPVLEECPLSATTLPLEALVISGVDLPGLACSHIVPARDD